LTPLPPHQEELETIMSRHLTQILQMVDLSHPAYFSFQNLQLSNPMAGDPSVLDLSSNIYLQPYSTCQPEAEPIQMSLIPELQPVSYNGLVTESETTSYTHHHKPRTWIPARPVLQVAAEPSGFGHDHRDFE
jgi:hypothetical protein